MNGADRRKRVKRTIIGSQRTRPFGALRSLGADAFAGLAQILAAQRTLARNDNQTARLPAETPPWGGAPKKFSTAGAAYWHKKH